MPEEDKPRKRLVKHHGALPLPGAEARYRSYPLKERKYVLASNNPEEECKGCCHECRYFNFYRCEKIDADGEVSDLECADNLPSTISICVDNFSEYDPLTKECYPYNVVKEPTDWWFHIEFEECDPDKPWIQCRGCYHGKTVEHPPPGPEGEKSGMGTEWPEGTIVVRVPKNHDYCPAACGWAEGSNTGADRPKIIEERHNGCDARWIPEGCLHECGYWNNITPYNLTLQEKCETCCDEHCWWQDYKVCGDEVLCSAFVDISLQCYCTTDPDDLRADELTGDIEPKRNCCSGELLNAITPTSDPPCENDKYVCMPDTFKIDECCYEKDGDIYLVRPYAPFLESTNNTPATIDPPCLEDITDGCSSEDCQGPDDIFHCKACWTKCPGGYPDIYVPKSSCDYSGALELHTGSCDDVHGISESIKPVAGAFSGTMELVTHVEGQGPYQPIFDQIYQWEDCQYYVWEDEITGEEKFGTVKFILSWCPAYEGTPDFARAGQWNSSDVNPFGGNIDGKSLHPAGCMYDAPWFNFEEHAGPRPGCDPGQIDPFTGEPCHTFPDDLCMRYNEYTDEFGEACDYAHAANPNPSGDHPWLAGFDYYSCCTPDEMLDEDSWCHAREEYLTGEHCADCKPKMICGALQHNDTRYPSSVSSCNQGPPPQAFCAGFCPTYGSEYGDGCYWDCHGTDYWDCGETMECMERRRTCRYKLRIIGYGALEDSKFVDWFTGFPVSCGPQMDICDLHLCDPYGGKEPGKKCSYCDTDYYAGCPQCSCCPDSDNQGSDDCLASYNCLGYDDPMDCISKQCQYWSHLIVPRIDHLEFVADEDCFLAPIIPPGKPIASDLGIKEVCEVDTWDVPCEPPDTGDNCDGICCVHPVGGLGGPECDPTLCEEQCNNLGPDNVGVWHDGATSCDDVDENGNIICSYGSYGACTCDCSMYGEYPDVWAGGYGGPISRCVMRNEGDCNNEYSAVWCQCWQYQYGWGENCEDEPTNDCCPDGEWNEDCSDDLFLGYGEVNFYPGIDCCVPGITCCDEWPDGAGAGCYTHCNETDPCTGHQHNCPFTCGNIPPPPIPLPPPPPTTLPLPDQDASPPKDE